MEIKGIDVSSYQGKPDWAKVAASGVKFALLRIHQQSGIDSSFEHNYKGCKSNGILVGGYKYSYALNVAQAEAEADAVLAVLNGRGLDFPVFYDLEWSKQREQCSRTTITKIVKAFLEKVKKAGYKVGIYCNVDWYNNALDTGSLPYDYWLAAYPYNDNGTLQERLRPKYGVGWQYSSKGTVPGISGAVDMDVFYKDYKEAKPMAVRMSNCGHGENNRYSGGTAGDQTGTEWYLRSWYSYPWNYIIRWKDQSLGNLFADLAVEAAQNNLVGYDQGQRETFWAHLKASNYRPSQITIACEADCSSGTIALIKAVGYLKGIAELKNCNATYTGNMMDYFQSASGKKYFEVLTGKYLTDSSLARRGDINLNTVHHVNITVDNGANSGSVTQATNLIGNCTPTLHTFLKGAQDNQVKAIQVLLKRMGYKGKDGNALKIDGDLGENTAYAIEQFQKKNEMKNINFGTVAAKTWELLLSNAK